MTRGIPDHAETDADPRSGLTLDDLAVGQRYTVINREDHGFGLGEEVVCLRLVGGVWGEFQLVNEDPDFLGLTQVLDPWQVVPVKESL